MVNADFNARAAERLARRRDELEQEIRAKLAAARDVVGSEGLDQVIEAGDYANADLIAALDIAEVQRDVAELRELDAARRRLDAGQYGLCIDCGVEIPLARLDAQPAALRCIACQTRAEQRGGTTPPRL
jgi:DnaK suppressor protein